MGLIVVIVVGGVLGWLASIVARADDRRGILMNVAIGVAGALVAGLVANNGSILSGLTPSALLVSLAAAVAALALANFLFLRGRGPS